MNPLNKIIACMGFAMVLTAGVSAQPATQWFAQANTYYEQQNYDSAVVMYEKIVATGLRNSDVYFNLGNAYFRLKRPGLALLNFEKAHRFSPNDRVVQANINFVNSQIVDRIAKPQPSFVEFVLDKAHNLFDLNIQLWIMLGLLFILAGCVSTLFFSQSRMKRLWLSYISVVLAAITVLFGLSAGIKMYRLETVREAIVCIPVVDAKNQPGGSKVLFTVHEGTKVTMGAEDAGWVLISLPNGVTGWVRGEVLGRI